MNRSPEEGLFQLALAKPAEKAALAESQQRARAEELLQAMQFQKAEDLLATEPSVPGVTLLGRMLRANPSNAVVASRFASAPWRCSGRTNHPKPGSS